MRVFICAGAVLLLSGCVTSVVKEVVTAPIKIVSKTADVLTTSQSESDEKRGREMRKREEMLGKMARQRDKLAKKCENGDGDSCEKAETLNAAIEAEQHRAILIALADLSALHCHSSMPTSVCRRAMGVFAYACNRARRPEESFNKSVRGRKNDRVAHQKIDTIGRRGDCAGSGRGDGARRGHDRRAR